MRQCANAPIRQCANAPTTFSTSRLTHFSVFSPRKKQLIMAKLLLLSGVFMLAAGHIHAQFEAYRAKARDLVQKMTLEEKASLCSGRDFWTTKPIERLEIPSIWLSDGPHGLRKAPTSDAGGLGNSLPATCFPTASAMASSWNTALARRVGEAIGDECQAQGVQIILGPGVNMKRSPLGGRNFEYYSEDPLLSGKMAAAFINGVQSRGVGTSLKHYAVNNQEFERMSISAELDERTLREIYLPAFEIAVKESQPWTVMCSYNKVNGVYASENEYLLNDILKKEWGLEGVAVTDWGAVNDRPEGVRAGLHLEMPGSGGFNDRKIVEAVKSGKLSQERLDEVVEELLAVILYAHAQRREGAAFDADAHHRLAREAAGECVALLKNEGNLLPLADRKKIAVIGGFAKTPRYQGAGSSQIVPTRIDNAWDELQKRYSSGLTYAAGYESSDRPDEALIEEARKAAKAADVAILFVGLPSKYESEGFDRQNIDLPPAHDALVEAVAAAQPNTVVVLTNGSAVAMPWRDKVKAIVEGWLTGQAGAGAVVDVLTGAVNPSGKLAETFPQRMEHDPAYLNWPGENGKVHHREGLFIGYRYYDAKAIEPLFPFGHGLSYTTFQYNSLSASLDEAGDPYAVTVKMKVKNTGKVAGKEVVQLYVRDRQSGVQRPDKELRAFDKVQLAPGEEKEIAFKLGKRDFAYYDPQTKAWRVESGEFDILAGASSRDIRLEQTVNIESADPPAPVRFDRYTPMKVWMQHPKGRAMVEPIMQAFASFGAGPAGDEEAAAMMQAVFMDMPMIKLVSFSQGMFTETMLDGMIQAVNE
jgi:beta-glucosidase